MDSGSIVELSLRLLREPYVLPKVAFFLSVIALFSLSVVPLFVFFEIEFSSLVLSKMVRVAALLEVLEKRPELEPRDYFMLSLDFLEFFDPLFKVTLRSRS